MELMECHTDAMLGVRKVEWKERKKERKKERGKKKENKERKKKER